MLLCLGCAGFGCHGLEIPRVLGLDEEERLDFGGIRVKAKKSSEWESSDERGTGF